MVSGVTSFPAPWKYTKCVNQTKFYALQYWFTNYPPGILIIAQAGVRFCIVMSVIFVIQSCLIQQMKGCFMLYYSRRQRHEKVDEPRQLWHKVAGRRNAH